MLLVMKAECPTTGRIYYFVDKCLPFGAAISCALFQKFSNAVAHIVSFFTGKKLINYLDDYFFVAFMKMMCNNQVSVFLQVCVTINFPVSKEKTFWGATRVVFLGLLIDTVNQVVAIPIDKIKKATVIIQLVVMPGRKKITLLEIQRLCGVLNFLSRAVLPGRIFTRRLYSYTRGLQQPYHHVRISKQMRADLQVWLAFLQFPQVFATPFMDFQKIWNADDIDLYTDASLNPDLGAGGINGTEWFQFPWNPEFIREMKPSIAYLELYAVTIGIVLWIHKYKNKRVALFCDNQSVIYMLNKMTSYCKRCMGLLRIIVLYGMLNNVRIFAKYVPSRSNTLSDALSRKKMSLFYQAAAEQGRTINQNPCAIPDFLSDMYQTWAQGI